MPQPVILQVIADQVSPLADRVRNGQISPRYIPADLQYLSPYPAWTPEP